MAHMMIHVPEELVPFRADLEYFVATMARKLHINRHKGFAENDNLVDLLNGLQNEVAELELAVKDESQFATMLEAVDVANMAFLVGLRAIRMDRPTFDRERRFKRDNS
jgi:hypothetical protein